MKLHINGHSTLDGRITVLGDMVFIKKSYPSDFKTLIRRNESTLDVYHETTYYPTIGFNKLAYHNETKGKLNRVTV